MTAKPNYFSTLIDTQELAQHLDDPDWLLFDARFDLSDSAWGRNAYQASHIPGAIYVSLDEDLSAKPTGKNGRHPLPSPEIFAQRMAQLGLSSEKQVIVYDQAQGSFAARLWWMLRWSGFDACAVLDGGFACWQQQTLPVEKTVRTPCAAEFSPTWRHEMRVEAREVLANLGTPNMRLIDARAAPRFRGENEILDAVGGHIPGALNRPYTENLTEGNRFKPAAQLRDEFEALLCHVPLANVVHQCGSGVTACHNILAMEIAGLSALRLYAGSWSEWCSDPDRPIAQGA